ncbi:MAG: hypothetical protein WDW36_002804 [Sanguina aurantia]
MGDLDEFFFCSDDSSLGPGKESSDFPQPPTDHSDPTAPAAQQAANPGGASSAALGGQLSDQPGTVTPAPIPGRLTLLPGMAQTSSSSSPQHATTTAAGVCVVGGATHGSGRPVTSLCVDTHLPIDTYSPRELDAEAEQLDAKVQLRDGSCSQLLLTLHSPATIPYREVSTLRARRSNTRGTTLLTPRSAAAAPPHSPGPLSPTATLPLAALSASVPDTPPSPTSPDPPSSSPASAPNTPPPPPPSPRPSPPTLIPLPPQQQRQYPSSPPSPDPGSSIPPLPTPLMVPMLSPASTRQISDWLGLGQSPGHNPSQQQTQHRWRLNRDYYLPQRRVGLTRQMSLGMEVSARQGRPAGWHTHREGSVIADRLSISEGTVRAHVTEILRKLGVRTRTQAALLVTEILPGEAGLDENADATR